MTVKELAMVTSEANKTIREINTLTGVIADLIKNCEMPPLTRVALLVEINAVSNRVDEYCKFVTKVLPSEANNTPTDSVV